MAAGSACKMWGALHPKAPQAQAVSPPAVGYTTLTERTKNSARVLCFQAGKKYFGFSLSFGLCKQLYRPFMHILLCLVLCIWVTCLSVLSSFKYLPTNCCFLDQKLYFCLLNSLLNWKHTYTLPQCCPQYASQGSEVPSRPDSNLKGKNLSQKQCLRASREHPSSLGARATPVTPN